MQNESSCMPYGSKHPINPSGKSFMIENCDNTTVLIYINHQEDSKFVIILKVVKIILCIRELPT